MFGRPTIDEALTSHRRLVAEFERSGTEVVGEIAQAIVRTFQRDGTLYLCGNGGSAADAQHVAGEFVGRFRRERRALPAVALSTDTSILTCVANDYDYDAVFARQIEAYAHERDILWGFSTSGASPNVLRAAEVARLKNARVIAFTGKKGSRLAELADYCLCAEADVTGRVQEIHQLAYHIICDLVEQSFAN
jgi:D-sedoheptulose 7-phosphate isomerase